MAAHVPLPSFFREFENFVQFSWRDWSASIIPGSIFALGAIRSSQPPMISRYILLLSWLTPFVYFFNLLNQINGVNEDRINKPDRPIPSGKVTINGAKWRCVIALLAFLSVPAFEPELLPETLCWISVVLFLCLTPAGNPWLGKSCVAMAVGAWSLLGASWKAIAPGLPRNEDNILAVSVWAGILTQIQDLRDARGDEAVGRKTMPIVFGDMATRRIIVLVLMPAALLTLWMGDILSIAPFTLTMAHLFLAYRVMHIGGPRYDHQTYMIYIFCLRLSFCHVSYKCGAVPREPFLLLRTVSQNNGDNTTWKNMGRLEVGIRLHILQVMVNAVPRWETIV